MKLLLFMGAVFVPLPAKLMTLLILESIPPYSREYTEFQKTTQIFFHPTSIWIVSSKVDLAVKAKCKRQNW